MAPTLTSNSSFLLHTTPQPSSSSRPNPRSPRLTVSAKKGGPAFPPFRLGKPAEPDENKPDGQPKLNPFSFDFGKVSDVTSLVPALSKSSSAALGRRKDAGTVFVAGATGQAGIRIARTLLREGFSVRAGVPDLGAAQELARLASNYKIISNEELKRLYAIESTFQDEESIAKTIGNASKLVVTIGSTENGPTNEVSTADALQVIKAAQLAGVSHVAIIYDGSTLTSTYNVLDGIQSFFNNLFSRSQPLTINEFLQELVETTDIRYTLIKTRLTEDYSAESSYNLVVAAEGSGGADDLKVAKSQIASLVADVFSNTSVAENKVVEVSTDPSAPSRTVDELFNAIPEDGRRAAYAEAVAQAKAEEEALKASERAREAAEATKRLEEEVKKLEEQEAKAASLAEEAEEKAAAAGASVESLVQDKAKGFGNGLSWEKLSSQLASAAAAAQRPSEKPKVQIATVRGQAKARTLPAKKAVLKPAAPKPKKEEKPKPKPKAKVKETEVRKVFGGLFQQETIYVDD